MKRRGQGLDRGSQDQVDLLLDNLHRLQRPGEFTPLAAACGWVKKEVPSGLLEEIMIRIQREERLRRCRSLCLTGGMACLLHLFVFIAAERVLNAPDTMVQVPAMVGSFWLLASLWFVFLLLIGFVLGYGVSKEVKTQPVISVSARIFPVALSRKS